MKIKNITQIAFLQNLTKAYVEGIYADTPANRKLGRVGMSYADYAKKVQEQTQQKSKKKPKKEGEVDLGDLNFVGGYNNFIKKYSKYFRPCDCSDYYGKTEKFAGDELTLNEILEKKKIKYVLDGFTGHPGGWIWNYSDYDFRGTIIKRGGLDRNRLFADGKGNFYAFIRNSSDTGYIFHKLDKDEGIIVFESILGDYDFLKDHFDSNSASKVKLPGKSSLYGGKTLEGLFIEEEKTSEKNKIIEEREKQGEKHLHQTDIKSFAQVMAALRNQKRIDDIKKILEENGSFIEERFGTSYYKVRNCIFSINFTKPGMNFGLKIELDVDHYRVLPDDIPNVHYQEHLLNEEDLTKAEIFLKHFIKGDKNLTYTLEDYERSDKEREEDVKGRKEIFGTLNDEYVDSLLDKEYADFVSKNKKNTEETPNTSKNNDEDNKEERNVKQEDNESNPFKEEKKPKQKEGSSKSKMVYNQIAKNVPDDYKKEGLEVKLSQEEERKFASKFKDYEGMKLELRAAGLEMLSDYVAQVTPNWEKNDEAWDVVMTALDDLPCVSIDENGTIHTENVSERSTSRAIQRAQDDYWSGKEEELEKVNEENDWDYSTIGYSQLDGMDYSANEKIKSIVESHLKDKSKLDSILNGSSDDEEEDDDYGYSRYS